MKLRKLSSKIVMFIGMIIVAFLIFFLTFLYFGAKSTVEQTLRYKGMDTAENIVENMSANQYKEFLMNPTETDTYWKIREELNDYRKITGALYVYTLDTSGSKLKVLVDGMDVDDENAASIGTETTFATKEDLTDVLNGEGSSLPIVDDPDYGKYLSAFAPIKGDNGEVIGVLGVDIAASNVSTIQMGIVKSIFPILSAILAIVMAFTLFLIHLYVRKGLAPISTLTASVQFLADGKVTEATETMKVVNSSGNDEIHFLIRHYLEAMGHLQQLLTQTKEATQSVLTERQRLDDIINTVKQTNDEINKSIYEVATSSDRQKQSNDESIEVMEEVTKGVQKIVDSSSSVASSSNEMMLLVTTSKTRSDEVTKQIQDVEQSVIFTEKLVHQLAESYKAIEETIDVISNISDQTNLLALNASIEAARAGEAGKGFAVVADEVRKLAEQSRLSAETVSTHILQFKNVTTNTLNEIEKSSALAKNGTTSVEEIASSLTKVLQAFMHVNDEIQEVSAATEEISASAQQLLASSEVIQSLINETVISTREVTKSSDDQVQSVITLEETMHHLGKTSHQLQQSIEQFK